MLLAGLQAILNRNPKGRIEVPRRRFLPLLANLNSNLALTLGGERI